MAVSGAEGVTFGNEHPSNRTGCLFRPTRNLLGILDERLNVNPHQVKTQTASYKDTGEDGDTVEETDDEFGGETAEEEATGQGNLSKGLVPYSKKASPCLRELVSSN